MATAIKDKPVTKSAPLKRDTGTASTSVAVRKPNANAVSIAASLKAQAEAMSGRVLPPGGNRIRATQDKQFAMPDGQKADSIEVVILDFRAVHNFYEQAYSKDEVSPPACYAIGLDPKNMVPALNSPNKQADDCNSCPMHEWGSEGKGKACNEGRLMACLPPDATEDTPIMLLQCSPTAVKGFDGYVSSVARTFQMPPIAVVTTVAFDEGQTFAQMVFTDPQPNKQLDVFFARQAEAAQILDAERDVSGYGAAAKKAPPAKKGARR